jgi:hypothetical protein
MTSLIKCHLYISTEYTVLCCRELLSACHERSAGSGVGINGYAILFHKTCVYPCIHYSYIQCTALLETTGGHVFRIGRGGVRPADFSWRANSTHVVYYEICELAI